MLISPLRRRDWELRTALAARKGFDDLGQQVPLRQSLTARSEIEPTPHDHQAMRRYDDGVLTACAVRGIGILRQIGSTIRHEPEMSSVLAATIAGGRRGGPDEIDPRFREYLFAVPLAAVQVQQTEAAQVARVGIDLAAQNVLAEPVHPGNRVAHSDAIEQRTAWEFLVGGFVPQRGAQRMHRQERVVVFVVPTRARLADQTAAASAIRRIRSGPVRERRAYHRAEIVVHWIQPSRHVQHVTECDLASWIGDVASYVR